MDIVCPVHNKDFDRFKILFRSLEKFCQDPFKIYLVSCTGDTPLYDPRIIPIKEDKLDRYLKIKKFDGKGWWKQQIIKLLSYKFCNSDHILSLDADCFAVKPFSFSEFLTPKKKIKTKISSGGSWDNWYIGSSYLLKLKLQSNWKEHRIGVTPFIFSNTLIESLWTYLKVLYKNPTATLLDNTYLAKTNVDGATWSEYCLYHVYGVGSGCWNIYHESKPNFELYGNCFWNTEDIADWNPSKSFTNPKFYFSVAQSIAGQSASWVDEQIKIYV